MTDTADRIRRWLSATVESAHLALRPYQEEVPVENFAEKVAWDLESIVRAGHELSFALSGIRFLEGGKTAEEVVAFLEDRLGSWYPAHGTNPGRNCANLSEFEVLRKMVTTGRAFLTQGDPKN